MNGFLKMIPVALMALAPVAAAPGAMAGDYAFCLTLNRVADGGMLKTYNDTQIRNGLCMAIKEATEAVGGGDETKQAICMQSGRHMMREFMRRFPGESTDSVIGRC